MPTDSARTSIILLLGGSVGVEIEIIADRESASGRVRSAHDGAASSVLPTCGWVDGGSCVTVDDDDDDDDSAVCVCVCV